MYFYCPNIRSKLCYGARAYFQSLSDTTKLKLEQAQMSATKIIFLDVPYPIRLAMSELCPLTLSDFILNHSESYFRMIATDNTHPHYGRITFNTSRRSSRSNTVFRPLKTKTKLSSNSFFTFFMNSINQRDHHF